MTAGGGLLRMLVVVLTLLTVLALRGLDVYHSYFDLADVAYLHQTVLQVVLAVVVVYLLWGVGERLLAWSGMAVAWPGFFVGEALLLSTFLGIWGVGLLAFGLAALGLLSPEITLGVTVVLLLVVRPQALSARMGEVYRQFCQLLALKSQDWPGRLELLAGAVLVGWLVLRSGHILLICGLAPQLPTNDEVGNYLPFYADLLANHGFWPTKWFIHYSFTKGAGFQYFVAALAGLFTVQLANVLLFFFSAGLLWWLLRRLGLAGLPGLVLVLLYAHSPVVSQFFVKNHGVMGAYLAMMLHLLARLLHSPPFSWRGGVLLTLAVVATVVFNPPLVVVVVGMAAAVLVVAWFAEGWCWRSRVALWVAGVAVVTMVGLSFWDVGQSGIGNFLFSHEIFENATAETTPAWDPLAIRMQHEINDAEGGITLSRWLDGPTVRRALDKVIPREMTRSLPMPLTAATREVVQVAALLLVLLGAAGYILNRWRWDPLPATVVALAVLVVVMAMAVLVGYDHAASQRGTLFRVFPLLLCLGAAIQGGVGLLATPRQRRLAAGVATLLLLAPWYNLWMQPPPNRLGSMARQLLVGRLSLLEAMGKKWPMAEEWQAAKVLPPGSRVVHLNFRPGAYLLPGVEYGRPLQNSYNPWFSQVMFTPAAEALAVLRQAGFDYLFLLPEAPLLLNARAAIFSAPGLMRHYRLLWQGKEGILLTHRPGEGRPLPAAFVERYRVRQQDPTAYLPRHWENFAWGLAEYQKIHPSP